MPSQAWIDFQNNANDVRRLMEIHRNLGGNAQGRRLGLEVLNKSAIVLITAIWESYCEDVTAEALQHIITQIPDANGLPIQLRKSIAKEYKSNPHETAMWDLAGDGWKGVVKGRLLNLAEKRNFNFNTPKSGHIDLFFFEALGIPAISNSWRWKGMSVANAKEKLDHYISLRGAIAHRGQASKSCKKKDVQAFFNHVQNIASRTGGAVNLFARKNTGVGFFKKR